VPLDHSLVGEAGEPYDPLEELEFTTENTSGVTQQVLPTFAVLISQAAVRRNLGDFDRALLVHAEQSFELHRPLPVEGTVRTVSTVTGMYDKGSGALITIENQAVDAGTGEPMVTARSGTFIRGEGGFGGDRGGSEPWERPERPADHEITLETRPEQALIYRLSGDRNPLHADPKFAARGGFARPILHGLCTYGVTGRALLHGLCGSDPARFAAMSGRFTRPVLPGDALTVSMWITESAAGNGTGRALFQTATQDGTVVIDRGVMRFRRA
jgi:acyl dehydratase